MLLVLSVLAAASAQGATTPAVMLNGKLKLAQVGEKGRIHAEYDVRSLGASGLKLYLFRHDEDPTGPPRKEWHFTQPAGRERISLNDQEIAVYRVWAQAVDEGGQPVAAPSPLVWIEYGGWRAWEAYENPEPDLTAVPPAFSEVPTQVSLSGRDVAVVVVPQAVVLRPNEAVEFQVVLKGLPENDAVTWKVEGEGWLQPSEQGKSRMIYVAPDVQGTKMFRVTATSERDPSIQGTASILVSSMRQDTGQP